MRSWLQELRSDSGMTQKQLAEKIGISESYYSYIEAGDRQKVMDISLAKKLSSIFNISIEQIAELESS